MGRNIHIDRFFFCVLSLQASKQANAWMALCPAELAFREPAGGASREVAAGRLAPEQGAPKSDRVGRHGDAAVTMARACWSLRERTHKA